MLWKKESRQPDALYIDLFKPNTQHWDAKMTSFLSSIEQKPHPVKSDAIASEKRNDGNEQFRRSKLLNAIESYSECLRFAQPGSEHISLAYANRAACFLKLKMYNECLIDIDHAVAARYPAHLRPKLDERKDRCLKEMQEDPEYPRDKLSIEPNEKFPCLSNLVNVEKNSDTGDYSLVAAADIDAGQVVVIVEIFNGYVTQLFGIYCNICTKSFCNLVPCGKCAVAMFCLECQVQFLHEHECGLNLCGENAFNGWIMTTVRSLLSTFKVFSTADVLMAFVEQMLEKPNQLPERMLDDRSKYQEFFNSADKYNIDEKVMPIYATFKALLRIPYVSEMFATSKHRRFLMHLAGHHGTIPRSTADIFLSVDFSRALGYDPIFINPVMHSYIKHSCYPNIAFVVTDGKCVKHSIKPIKKGEQLLHSYTPFGMNSTTERKKVLWDSFKINCECSRCLGKEASPAQRQHMASGIAFRNICAIVRSFAPLKLNIKNVETATKLCERFLQIYGELDWCEEIAYVTKGLKILYAIQLLGGGADLNNPFAREYLSHCQYE